MTTARCPACGASVLDGAPWCTLCYADLRAPATPPAAAPTVPAQPPASAGPKHAAAPRHAAPANPSTTPGSSVDLLDPLLDAPVVAAPQAARGPATWPCSACGASVALEHDACPQCGTGFLAGADPVAVLDLPLVGPIRPLAASKSSRVWLVIGGALAVCVVLTVLLSLIGQLL